MRRLTAAAALVVALTGCGADRPEPAENAIQLDQNLPTNVGDHRVIAFNMDDDEGTISVDGERTTVSVGDTIDVAGTTYEVVQVVPDDDGSEGPDGWISIRER